MPTRKRKIATKTTKKKRAIKKPASVLIAQIEPTLDAILIHHGEHRLSPHVVNLRKILPTSGEMLNEQTLRLNLLGHSMTKPTNFLKAPTNALYLSKTEIEGQLQEELPNSLATYRLARRQGVIPTCPEVSMEKLTINLPKQESISLNAFLPKQTPEDIFAYFDLPDAEAGEVEELQNAEESELVELDKQEILPAHPIQPQLKPWAIFLRPVSAFVLISFIFVLPLHAMNLVTNLRQAKSEVETVSKEGFSYLQTNAFSRANERFSNAQKTITELGIGASIVLSAIPNAQKNLSSGRDLLEAGEHLSIAGERMTSALKTIAKEVNPTPVSRLEILRSYLRSSIPHLKEADRLLSKIDTDMIPEEQRATFLSVQEQLPTLISSLSEFDELSTLAAHILGADTTQRYLLIFQNNAEIRPTGGFMGSFAEVKVRNGILEQMSVPGGGTYDLQGLLQQSRIAPEPLQLLSARWEFQDANWFPDFPTSARQIIEFYRDAGGPSIDGVIAINATYVADLIGLLGPIEMENYGRTIDQENFLFEAQKIVEFEYNKTINKPKQFIGDLAPKLIERALEGEAKRFLTLIDHLSKGLAEKDIQLYFSDEETQRQILTHGWSGSMIQTPGDYLMIVNTNLGGGKTDAVIEEKVDVQIEIAQDGSITNTVTLTRIHHGIPGVVFSGVNNVDYVRLYVPKGSELINAKGFQIPDERLFEMPSEEWLKDDDLQYASLTKTTHEESRTDVYEENGKTVFGNWVQTAPGDTSEIQFTYRLPQSIFEKKTHWAKTSPYTLTIQKQPGIMDRTTNVTVALSNNIRTVWKSIDDSTVSFDNKTDGFVAMLLSL